MAHVEAIQSVPLETTTYYSALQKTRRVARTTVRIGAGTFFAAASLGFLSIAPVRALHGDGEDAIGCAVDAPIAAGISAYIFKNRLRHKVNAGAANFGHELIEGFRELKQDIHSSMRRSNGEIVLEEDIPNAIEDPEQLVVQQIEPLASETFSSQESL